MAYVVNDDRVQTEAMNDVLANNWWAVALRGVFAIVFGVIAIAMPAAAMLSLALVFGAFSVVDGIFGVVTAVRGATRREERWGWLLANGILGIVAGVIALVWPGITVLAYVLLVAAWALISGVFMLAAAWRLKIDHGRIWLVLAGIASVGFGILLAISPLIGALVLTIWAGAHALVLGALLLVLAWRLREHRTAHPQHSAATQAS